MTPKGLHIASACAILALAFPLLAQGAARPQPNHNRPPRPRVSAVQVQPADLEQIIQCLMGPNVEVSNAVLTAAPNAAGLFIGGTPAFGINQGLVLSTGNVASIMGPNLWDDISTDNSLPGDPDLDALIPGYVTYDATILEFDFECPDPTAASFQYVFTSDEYNEWVDTDFNDVFGFFLNGVNIAITPAICSRGGIPVAINNVNCGNPYAPPGGLNCDCYRNNALPDGGGTIDTEMDGLTQVFYATGQIQPGVNHMKIAIADAGDHVYDSNVLLRCQSFVCGEAPPVGACCTPDECYLLDAVECVDEGGVYLGDGRVCFPNPCASTPVRKATWGKLKTIYR